MFYFHGTMDALEVAKVISKMSKAIIPPWHLNLIAEPPRSMHLLCVHVCVTMPEFLSFLINVISQLTTLSKPAVCMYVLVFFLTWLKLSFCKNVDHYNLIQPFIDLVSAMLSSV